MIIKLYPINVVSLQIGFELSNIFIFKVDLL